MQEVQRRFIEDIARHVADHNHEGIVDLPASRRQEPFARWITPETPDVDSSMVFLSTYSARQMGRVTEKDIRFRYNDVAERSMAANEAVGALVLLRGILQSSPAYASPLTELDSAMINLGDKFNPARAGELAERYIGARPAVTSYIGSQDLCANDRRITLLEAMMQGKTGEVQHGFESVRLIVALPQAYLQRVCSALNGDGNEQRWTAFNLKQKHPEVFDRIAQGLDGEAQRTFLYNGRYAPQTEWMGCPS